MGSYWCAYQVLISANIEQLKGQENNDQKNREDEPSRYLTQYAKESKGKDDGKDDGESVGDIEGV